ncbi:2-dehydro-3-deoxygalactonokinase [Celeribacter baekdonensis]|uniref:2-dehydro-3-deoxygalactonokinase n=2 Tax=Celeribacter baekdonensis TaxID=875171 RepID=A0A1G7LWF2_9RHOB|nr:2-dehydro-3-deoxygalactonokinase [Celeribacter baekdonensis]
MGMTMTTPDWIAVDWTALGLTIWGMDAEGAVLTKAKAEAPADTAGFDAALATILRGWDISPDTPIVAAGRFAHAPRAVPNLAMPEHFSTTSPLYFPALSQQEPRHVTLGMEAAIAGFVTQNPKFDGVLCLPGARMTVWAHISAEEVVSFRSVATGLIMTGLAQQSGFDTLLSGDTLDEAIFTDAVSDAMSRPEQVSYRIASLEAETYLGDLPPARARSIALGLLIGAELAATRPYWLGQPIALIGDADLRAPYGLALDAQYAMVNAYDRAGMVHAGLYAAFRKAFG